MTAAEYITWTDICCQAINVLLIAKGDEDTPASAAGYAADLRDAITALDQPDEADITIDLLGTVQAMVEAMTLESSVSQLFSAWNSAITRHLAGDVNDLLNGDPRVHYLWRQAGNLSMDAENVFPPVTILGTYVVSGAGAGTLTKVNNGTTGTNYAGAALEVKVINQQLGASEIVMTVNGTNFSGGALSKTATIESGAAMDSVHDVGVSTDWFKTITTVTITGGTAGDDLQIQTKVDRTLA